MKICKFLTFLDISVKDKTLENDLPTFDNVISKEIKEQLT